MHRWRSPEERKCFQIPGIHNRQKDDWEETPKGPVLKDKCPAGFLAGILRSLSPPYLDLLFFIVFDIGLVNLSNNVTFMP